MDYKWIHFESWHAVGQSGHTLCGLDLVEQDPSQVRDEPPGVTEQSCENCLRIIVGREDAGLIAG